MLEVAVFELLESGCALIAGLVAADGTPLASRGWALELLDGGTRARVLLPADDLARLGYNDDDLVGVPVAVTGANVLTLRSVQLKGPVVAVEPPVAADLQRSAAYCDKFFDDVASVDRVPRRLMDRMVPKALVAVVFEIVELYDQTPGPSAGTAVRAVQP